LDIDLGEIKDIERIEVWNRDDCCTELLSDFYILVSNAPFANSNLNVVTNQIGVSSYLQEGEAARPTAQAINKTGRFIRVQLTGTAFLAITELKIIGCEGDTSCPPENTPCDDNDPTTLNDVEDGFCNCQGVFDTGSSGCVTPMNLALNKPSTQSSTLNAGGITGDAAKAVDGNDNGAFFTTPTSSSSVSATDTQFQPWWEVDLEANNLIESINFYNRTDGVDKTQNCYVLISNNPFTSADLVGARAEASYEYYISGLVGSPSVINPNVEGQYIRVQMEGSGYLVIAELEAMGCEPPLAENFTVPNLLTFNAEKLGQEGKLNWWMFKDEYVDRYELEISLNDKDYEILKTVNARQINTPTHYEIWDRKPTHGVNFYRLKVIQNDGRYSYSYPRRLNFDIDFEKIDVYPNPTSDRVYLTMRDFAGQTGTVEIFNSYGQQVMKREYTSFPMIPVRFDMKNNAGGVYSMVVKVDNYRMFTKKFVVVKR